MQTLRNRFCSAGNSTVKLETVDQNSNESNKIDLYGKSSPAQPQRRQILWSSLDSSGIMVTSNATIIEEQIYPSSNILHNNDGMQDEKLENNNETHSKHSQCSTEDLKSEATPSIRKVKYDSQSGEHKSTEIPASRWMKFLSGKLSRDLVATTAKPTQRQDQPDGASAKRRPSAWFKSTYKARSLNFRRHFPELPSNETLIMDYSCALQRDILHQGRMYVSQNYLCFHSSIFNWSTILCVPWAEVTAISKTKTALVIPNAISILTEKNRYFFASFVKRNKAFQFLMQVWLNALDKEPFSKHELQLLARTHYSDEPVDNDGCTNSEGPQGEVIDVQNAAMNVKAQRKTAGAESVAESPLDTQMQQEYATQNANTSPEKPTEFRRKSSKKLSIAVGTRESDGSYAAGERDPSNINFLPGTRDQSFASRISTFRSHSRLSHRSGHVHIDPDIRTVDIGVPRNELVCTADHSGTLVMRMQVPKDVESVFKCIFTESDFIKDLHAKRSTTDVEYAEWDTDEDGNTRRTISMVVEVSTGIGGGKKGVQVTEQQTMHECSVPCELYSIDVNVSNKGVPYADSFTVLMHYCLERVNQNETLLSVYGQINYKKNVWSVVKTFIEKNTWEGISSYCMDMQRAFHKDTQRGSEKILSSDQVIRSSDMRSRVSSKSTKNKGTFVNRSLLVLQTRAENSAPMETKRCRLSAATLLSLFLCFLLIVNCVLILRLDVRIAYKYDLECVQQCRT